MESKQSESNDEEEDEGMIRFNIKAKNTDKKVRSDCSESSNSSESSDNSEEEENEI